MDEPFFGIDPASQRIMIDLMHEYKEQNSTTIITIHDRDLLKTIYNSFVVIQKGKAVYASGGNEDINNVEQIY
ncbi:MAG: hypothetical protein LBG43_05800 [Treponema sp.]|jgi:ABC-type multidrug transport system ATPase subunit|nr:hypothetical protein [Treponema sp.]